MKHIEVSIQITIKPTEASVDSGKVATKVADGQFRVVRNEGARFDIDALEQAVL